MKRNGIFKGYWDQTAIIAEEVALLYNSGKTTALGIMITHEAMYWMSAGIQDYDFSDV